MNTKVWFLLDEKLSAIYWELFGPQGAPLVSSAAAKLLKDRWRLYLGGIGATFTTIYTRPYDRPSMDLILNPLHTEDPEFMVIELDKETTKRILVLGLP